MNLKMLLTSLSPILLLGCSWMGYKEPKEQDFLRVSDSSSAFVLGVQNFGTDDLSQARLVSVKEVLADVQDIFQNNTTFEKLIVEQDWVAACDSGELEKVSGQKLLSDLRELSVQISVFPKKPWMAIGLTDTFNRRIAIDPSRIDLSGNDEVIDASWLVETTAHEITHLILDENGLVKYRDRGHGKKGCEKNELVSYRVGKAAQAAWIHTKLSE